MEKTTKKTDAHEDAINKAYEQGIKDGHTMGLEDADYISTVFAYLEAFDPNNSNNRE